MKVEVAAALLMERMVRGAYSEKHSTAIQPLQWTILRYLSAPSNESRDIKSICRYVGITPAPISRAISTLEGRQLVTKKPHPESKRSVVVTITEKGLKKLADDPILKIANRINAMNERDRDRFVRILRQLMIDESGL